MTDQIRMTRRGFAATGAGTTIAALSGTMHAQHSPDAPVSTPATTNGDQSPISRFLSHAPATLLEHDPEEDRSLLWCYTDLAQQFDAFGITPAHDDPRAILITQYIYLRNSIFPWMDVPDFTAAIGFEKEAIQQILTAGYDDNFIQMMTLDMSLDTLPDLWESVGYTHVTVADSRDAWTLGGPSAADIDWDHPIQGMAITDCNNVTITGNGVIVFARDLALLDEVQQGYATSMLAAPEIAGLAAQLPAELVGCECVSGVAHTMNRLNLGLPALPDVPGESSDSELAEIIQRQVQQSDQAVGPMPEWSYMVMGVLTGTVGNDRSTGLTAAGEGVCRIHAGNPDDAAQVAEVVRYRWQNGPDPDASGGYNDIAEISGIGSEGGVAIVNFDSIHDPATFVDIQFQTRVWPFLHGGLPPSG